MPTPIDDLYAARADKISKAGKLREEHAANWTTEHENQFNALHDAADKDLEKIAGLQNAAQRTQAAADRQARAEEQQRQARARQAAPNPVAGPAGAGGIADALGDFRGRPLRLRAGGEDARRAAAAYVEAFRSYLGGGHPQGLVTDDLQNGGYLAPPQFVASLIRELDDTFWMRRLANVLPPTNAPSVSWPRRAARMTGFAWGEYVDLAVPNNTLKLGMYTLTPHYLSGFAEISKDLLRASPLDVEALVRGEIRYDAEGVQEQAFLYGDGVKKPLGVFVPSDLGIPTTRDVTGPLTSADTFIDAKYSLREPYLRSDSLRWLFNRLGVRALAKLKSTTGEPLWLVSTRDGQPETFLGVPVILSEAAAKPSGASGGQPAYATGDYTGLIGDLKSYDIQDSLDLAIDRHNDAVFNARNTVGYITRMKVDGNTRFAEAFARVKKD